QLSTRRACARRLLKYPGTYLAVVPVPHPPFYFFFFYCSRPHRDLHSFPTRRSSDLTRRPVRYTPPAPPRSSLGTQVENVAVTVRSEEHTSELQSREKLVCRLLLEKKKKITYSLN